MSNDRVHIVCKGCRAWKMLLKFYPGLLYPEDNSVLDWAELHSECHPRQWDSSLRADPGFFLVAESDPNFDAVVDLARLNAPPPDKSV